MIENDLIYKMIEEVNQQKIKTESKLMRAVDKFLSERDEENDYGGDEHWYSQEINKLNPYDHEERVDHHKEQEKIHTDIADHFAKTGNKDAEEMHRDVAWSHGHAAELNDEAKDNAHSLQGSNLRRVGEYESNLMDRKLDQIEQAKKQSENANEYSNRVMAEYPRKG